MARLVVGVNDLFTLNPELAAQWHPTKNGQLTPQNVTGNSGRKVWWLCSLHHEWEISVNTRAKGSGCAFCCGQRVLAGFNDLASVNQELAAQWHPTKNGTLTPKDFTAGSGSKVWWICPLFHEWEATISSRTKGRGCHRCSGRLLIVGSNDLATLNPALAAQWHPTKNGVLTPRDVMVSTNKKVWWICSLFHEWATVIADRTRGYNCPYCSGQSVLAGFNDLLTTNASLAAQWHPTRNGALTPAHVSAGASHKVWWICDFGHEWKAVISSRTGAGAGCSKCSVRITEKSFLEAFIKLSGITFQSDRISLIRPSRKFDRAQIDILNENLRLAIEYDGQFSHGENALYKNTLKQKLAEDKETTQALVDIGYKVIRIREHGYKGRLHFISLDSGYESNVFQITYKSFGKDKDNIEDLTQKIITEKKEWFKASN